MDLSKINIGIIHSIIGKNDGVSIVIDQSVFALHDYLKVPLSNVYYLAALAPSRLNKLEDDIFWHKNKTNRHILQHYQNLPSEGAAEFENLINKKIEYCLKKIVRFVSKFDIDILLAHNACHPTNFVYATALGKYIEMVKKKGNYFPRYILWWHDSHLERERFQKPNAVIKKYLPYIPGKHIDGIIFINSHQQNFAKEYFKKIKLNSDLKKFFAQKCCVLPNTFEIDWNWKKKSTDQFPSPNIDSYNEDFLDDIGINKILYEHNRTFKDAVFFLQHTRIVKRKRIDIALNFAFKIANLFEKNKQKKIIILLISGHSGDELDKYSQSLEHHYAECLKQNSHLKNNTVIYKPIEDRIFPEREILHDSKYYRFRDVPGIVANLGGFGTYFSELEGYGNNLLEMIGGGLPVFINEYPVYQSDIKSLNFKLPSITNCTLNQDFIEQSYQLITNSTLRKEVVLHNLKTLEEKLNHSAIANKLAPVLKNALRYL